MIALPEAVARVDRESFRASLTFRQDGAATAGQGFPLWITGACVWQVEYPLAYHRRSTLY